MNPYLVRNLFGIAGLDIHWYAVIMCLGIIGGLSIGIVLAKKRGYTIDLPTDILLWCIPICIIGARLYYVIFEWEAYKGDFLKIFAVWEGGLAIYGAVIAAFITCYFFAKKTGISFGDIIDIGAPGLILGQAIGRWGNFVNQEAFGALITNPSMQWFPYGVYIERLGEWHQATFFYESMWNLLVFAFLLWYFKRAKRKGDVGVMYLLLYGIGRAFIEGLRTDSLWLIPGVIRVSQLLSILLILAAVYYFIIMRKKPIPVYSYHGKYAIGYEEAAEEAQEIDFKEEIQEETAPEKKDTIKSTETEEEKKL